MKEASEEQKRTIRKKLDTFSHHIGRRTVIFLWEDDDGIPRQKGTGVLLAIDRRRFIITAAHVADQIKFEFDAARLTFIAGCGMFERMPIPLDHVVVLLSPLEGTSRRLSDLHDIAAVELSHLVIDELEGHNTYLELGELDLTTGQNDRGQFFIYGVTASSGQADLERRILTTESFPIVTDLFSGDMNELIIFDPEIGLVFG